MFNFNHVSLHKTVIFIKVKGPHVIDYFEPRWHLTWGSLNPYIVNRKDITWLCQSMENKYYIPKWNITSTGFRFVIVTCNYATILQINRKMLQSCILVSHVILNLLCRKGYGVCGVRNITSRVDGAYLGCCDFMIYVVQLVFSELISLIQNPLTIMLVWVINWVPQSDLALKIVKLCCAPLLQNPGSALVVYTYICQEVIFNSFTYDENKLFWSHC